MTYQDGSSIKGIWIDAVLQKELVQSKVTYGGGNQAIMQYTEFTSNTQHDEMQQADKAAQGAASKSNLSSNSSPPHSDFGEREALANQI